MSYRRSCQALSALALFLGVLGWTGMGESPSPGRAFAGAPSKRFLEALLENDFHDEAIDYLDSVAANTADETIPQPFRKALDYERGLALLEASRSRRLDFKKREQELDDSEKSFKKYLQEQETGPYAIKSQLELGNLLMERAALLGQRSTKPNANKAELFGQARTKLKEASDVFAAAHGKIKAELEGFPKAGLNPAQAARRDELREDLLEALMLGAGVWIETSKYCEPNSPERKAALDEAVKRFADIGTKYGRMAVGLQAIVRRGECEAMLGDPKKALGTLDTVLSQTGEDPDLRSIYTQALLAAVPCWTQTKEFPLAFSKVRPAVDDLDVRGMDKLGWKLLSEGAELGSAYVVASKSANPKPADLADVTKWTRGLLRDLQKNPNYAKRAQELQTSLGAGGIAPTAVAVDYKAPKDFNEADQKQKDAFREFNTALTESKNQEGLIGQIANPEEKAAAQKELDELKKSIPTNGTLALLYTRDCLRMANKDTSIDTINDFRYRVAFLAMNVSSDPLEGAVAGEFLATRHPRFPAAPKAAQIAVACYQKMILAAQADGRIEDAAAETDRLVALGRHMQATWPTDEATLTVVPTMIQLLVARGAFDEAQATLKLVPEDSPKRGPLELKIGMSVWVTYLTKANDLRKRKTEIDAWVKDGVPAGENADQAKAKLQADMAENDKLKAVAPTFLENAIARLKPGAVTDELAIGAYQLASIYVDAGQSAKALELLSDAKIGPLVLIEAKHAVTQRPSFIDESYKTALRARIGALSQAVGNAEEHIAEAKKIVDAMKARVGGVENGAERLAILFRGLANDLEKQLQLAPAEQRPALAAGIELVVDQVAGAGEDQKMILWANGVYRRVADVLGKDAAGKPTTEAMKYLGKAEGSLQRISDSLEKKLAQKPPPPTAAADLSLFASVLRDRAKIKRSLGDTKAALELYAKFLADPKLRATLVVQVEAAETLDEVAETTPNDVAGFMKAIKGDNPDAKKDNILWGWNKISTVLNQVPTRTPAQDDVFFEARLRISQNLARSAKALTDKPKRDKQYNSAAQTISTLYQKFPSLGGPERTKRFDALLKSIQTEQGQPATGVAGLPKPIAADKPAPAPENPAPPAEAPAPATGLPAPGSPAPGLPAPEPGK